MKNNSGCLIAWLFALAGCQPSDHGLPRTALFEGIEKGTDYAVGTQLIQRRLQTRFPTGSSELQLNEYLKQQGMKVERATKLTGSVSGVASFRYGGPVCGSQVRIQWEADAKHRIETVDGLYSDTGCP